MDNNDWTNFKDKLTPEQRAAVETAQAHYFDDALTSYLKAFLAMQGDTERQVSAIAEAVTADRADRGLILGHLERGEAWQQRQEAAVNGLRADFQSLFEVVNGHTLDIGELKQTVAEHEREIASFRRSRDESIQERRELRADLTASKEDRIKIHKELKLANDELKLASDERKAITDALARIEREMKRGNGH
jgi:chromosome segregation ATPase